MKKGYIKIINDGEIDINSFMLICNVCGETYKTKRELLECLESHLDDADHCIHLAESQLLDLKKRKNEKRH